MNITTTTTTRTTFTVERLLTVQPPSGDKPRGIFYLPNYDEMAAGEAKKHWDAATKAIRDKAKSPELQVGLNIDRRGDELFAVYSGTKTT